MTYGTTSLAPRWTGNVEYGVGRAADDLDAQLAELSREVGEREAAKKLGISRTALRHAMRLGAVAMSRAVLSRLGSIGRCLPTADLT